MGAKLVRRLLCAIALFSLGPCAAHARAEGKVLLFEVQGLRSSLCAAMRIQLTDVAEVRCRPETGDAPLASRVARAAALVREEEAALGVLLERDPDPERVRMVLVGAADDQAVLAIERIVDRPEPDVDRSLALKVRDALERLGSTPPALAPRAATMPEATMPMASILASAPPPEPATRFRTLLEAGGALSIGTDLRGLGLFGAGIRMARARAYVDGLVAGQVATTLRTRAPEGAVTEDEWGAALSLRGGFSRRRFALGLYGELGALSVRAIGTTTDGSTGSVRRGLFRSALGIEARLALFSGVALRFAPAVELYPVAQRFALDDRVVVELGRARLSLPLTLLVAIEPQGGDG
jgi:hypothetical protein